METDMTEIQMDQHVDQPTLQNTASLETIASDLRRVLYNAYESQWRLSQHAEPHEQLSRVKKFMIAVIRGSDLPNDLLLQDKHRRDPDREAERSPQVIVDPPVVARDGMTSVQVRGDNRMPKGVDVIVRPGGTKPDTLLQPPSSHRRNKLSDASSASEPYSVISDGEVQAHEQPSTIDMWAYMADSRSCGQKFNGVIDTGHLGCAPLLTRSTATDLGWRLAPIADDTKLPILKFGYGSQVLALGKIDLDTQFRAKDGTCLNKARITYYVVPDGSIPGDCLVNWKTIARLMILRYWAMNCLIDSSGLDDPFWHCSPQFSVGRPLPKVMSGL